MTKLFRQTVEQVEKLPESEQDAAARGRGRLRNA
jgi:hypothetical protein